MIELTIIGTAATMPLPNRALSCLQMKSQGKTVLFDCGEGTQTAARKAQVSLMKTELIAFTHFHGDHTFGLPGLLQTMSCMGRTERIFVSGPDGLEPYLGQLLCLAGPLPFDVIPIRIDNEGYSIAGGILRAFPVRHRVPAQGYSFELPRAGKFDVEKADNLKVPLEKRGLLQKGQPIEVDGKTITPEMVMGPVRKSLKVVYSGDTSPCDSLVQNSYGADVLFCDGTYGSDEKKAEAVLYGHSTYSQAAQVAVKAGVKKLVLTHFSQMMENPEEYLESATGVFENSECAEDGKKIWLTFDGEERR